ncbi:hypothetical protein H0N96_00285 [Candidatus Micrarchaeota archaeon]|nr:hypothetical protein [Candidatus Micrarchaeota archaeon]
MPKILFKKRGINLLRNYFEKREPHADVGNISPAKKPAVKKVVSHLKANYRALLEKSLRNSTIVNPQLARQFARFSRKPMYRPKR